MFYKKFISKIGLIFTMKRFIITLFFSFYALLQLQAQHTNYFEQYHILRSQGAMPPEFSKGVKDLVSKNSTPKKSKKTKSRFKKKISQEIEFTASSILQSGDVLYNDEVSKYLNRIADQLLIQDKALRAKISIHTVRSTSLQSFVTSNGMICIPLGILAKVKNESEVAYIIARQIAHFQKQHPYDAKSYRQELVASSTSIYNSINKSKNYLASSLYSFENDRDVDTAALKYFENDFYTIADTKNYFKHFIQEDAPFLDKNLVWNDFEKTDLKISNMARNFTPMGISTSIENVKSSNPELYARYILMDSVLNIRTTKSMSDKYVDQKEFDFIQKVARYELSYLYLVESDYISSYYNSYLCMEQDSSNLYLIQNKCKALYWLSKNRDITDSLFYNSYSGQEQKLAYMLYDLKENPIRYDAFLLRYVTHYRLLYPTHPDINNMFTELMKKHVVEYNLTEDSITSAFQNFQKTRADSLSWSSFLFPLLVNDEFKNELKKYQEIKEGIITYQKEYPNFFITTPDQKLYGRAAGVQNVIAANPTYMRIVRNMEDAKLNISRTKKGELKYITALQQMSKLVGLKINIIKPTKLKPEDTDKLTHLALLNHWLEERLVNIDPRNVKTSSAHKVSSIPEEELDRLANAYQTEHVMWQMLVHNRDSRYMPINVLASFLLFTLPNTVPAIIKNGNSMYLYTMVYNIRSGELEFFTATYIDDRMYKYMLEGKVYNDLYQVYQVPWGGEVKPDMLSDKSEKVKKKNTTSKKRKHKKRRR